MMLQSERRARSSGNQSVARQMGIRPLGMSTTRYLPAVWRRDDHLAAQVRLMRISNGPVSLLKGQSEGSGTLASKV